MKGENAPLLLSRVTCHGKRKNYYPTPQKQSAMAPQRGNEFIAQGKANEVRRHPGLVNRPHGALLGAKVTHSEGRLYHL